MRRGLDYLFVALYLGAAVASNFSVLVFGPISTPFNAFVMIAFDLVTRDALHERWRNHLWRNMLMLVGVGSIITYALNAGAVRIAVASTLAFLFSGIADAVVYQLLHRFPRLRRVVGSNVVSAAVDSIVFPTIAFGAIIPFAIIGQWVAKVLGSYIWALIFTKTIWRETVEPEA